MLLGVEKIMETLIKHSLDIFAFIIIWFVVDYKRNKENRMKLHSKQFWVQIFLLTIATTILRIN